MDSPTRVDSIDLWKSRCHELEYAL